MLCGEGVVKLLAQDKDPGLTFLIKFLFWLRVVCNWGFGEVWRGQAVGLRVRVT
jgi:hypothetical protein